MLTPTEIKNYIEMIRQLPEQLEARVAGLTQEQLNAVTIPQEWTVRQIVHHLADAHMVGFARTKLILTLDKPTLQAYPQEIWAELADVPAVPIQASLAILRGLHERWVIVWENVRDEDWDRIGLHSDVGETVLSHWLRTYANHCTIHLDQIDRVLAAGTA